MKRNDEDAEVGEGSLGHSLVEANIWCSSVDEQHTLCQPRRWKDKLERGRSFVVFDYLLSKDSRMLDINKRSHIIKKRKNSYPPNTSKGQMVF